MHVHIDVHVYRLGFVKPYYNEMDEVILKRILSHIINLDWGNGTWTQVGSYAIIEIWNAFMDNPTINKRRSKVYNNCIAKTVYARKGAFMKMSNVIIWKH